MTNLNSSQPNSSPSTPGAARAAQDLEIELFNAIAKGDDVKWQLRNPIDASAVEILETPKSKINYPWNPSESEAFFQQADAENLLNSFDDSELDQQAAGFFSHLDQLWDKSLQTTLARKFATVPQAILTSIATQAQSIAQQTTTQSNQLLDQLASIVQTAMPQWAIEDLQVLGRPMAYAMRGEGTEEFPGVQTEWDKLSSTEQAKLSLAIARYALEQAQA